MADDRKIRLFLGNTELDLTNDKYTESNTHVDSWNVTEAGTNLRAVVRTHITSLSISYECDASEKAILDVFDKASKMICTRWSEEDSDFVEWSCCMTGYSADLILETDSTRLYKVSFKLEDLEE